MAGLSVRPGIQFVADAVYSADYLFTGQMHAYLFAKVFNVGVYCPVITFEIISLNDINQLVSRKNPIRAAQQHLQKIILTGRKLEFGPPGKHLASFLGHDQPGGLQRHGRDRCQFH